MVGMHLTKTRGGITTLTKDILSSDLLRDYEFNYISSQAEEYGRVRKVLLAITSFISFTAQCLLKRPALVYVHIGSNASLYRESAFIVVGRLLGKSVISHFHAGDIDEYFPKQPAIGKTFIRWSISLSHIIIAVSKMSERQLRNMVPAANVRLILNTIDITSIRPSLRTNPDSIVRLLFVGATGKLKGEHDLLNALASLRETKPEIRVTMLGFGAETLRATCLDLGILDLIEHLGPVSVEERIAYFERADIFVLPTYAEGMPISVIEAMAAGLAIISTPVGGVPDLIDNGKDGFLVPVGDVDALAEKIKFLVNNPFERKALGNNARIKCLRLMDFDSYIQKLRVEIENVCEVQSRSI